MLKLFSSSLHHQWPQFVQSIKRITLEKIHANQESELYKLIPPFSPPSWRWTSNFFTIHQQVKSLVLMRFKWYLSSSTSDMGGCIQGCGRRIVCFFIDLDEKNHIGSPSTSSLSLKRSHLSNSLKQRVYNATQGRCYYCNTTLGGFSRRYHRWEIDHYYPISRGGTNDFSNLVASCFACNRAKSSKTAMEFISSSQYTQDNNIYSLRCRHFYDEIGRLCLHSPCQIHPIQHHQESDSSSSSSHHCRLRRLQDDDK